MCAGCAMAAAAGATGVRTWLQAHHRTWLTPSRMRAITIALIAAAFAVSSLGISGSTQTGATPRAASPATAVGAR